MSVPGFWELMIIGGIMVLFFGAKKLPALGGAIGESIKNFKKGIAEGEPKQLSDTQDKSTKDTDPR